MSTPTHTSTIARGQRKRKHRGQAAVEFGLAAAFILFPMLMAVIEGGRVMYASTTNASAARAGVQYGAQNLGTATDNTGMKNGALADATNVSIIAAAAKHFCTCSNGNDNEDCQPTDCGSGTEFVYVQVDTTASFQTLLNYPGIPTPVRLHSTAVMRVRQ